MSIPAPFRRTLATASCLLWLGGCAATTPAPRFSSESPADPTVAEGVESAPAPMLTGSGELAEKSPAPPSPAGHEHHGTAGSATTYTCSMHPEVKASEPGKCPICGMVLVKKPAAAREHP